MLEYYNVAVEFCETPRIKLFMKSLLINRPLCVTQTAITGKNKPLLQIKSNGCWQVLADSKIRCHHLSLVLKILSLCNKGFSFHSFISFPEHHLLLIIILNHMVPGYQTQYLFQDPSAPSQVALAFQGHLSLDPTP